MYKLEYLLVAQRDMVEIVRYISGKLQKPDAADWLVMELVTATDPKDKERAYRKLEKAGVDRITADVMAAEFWKEGQK